MSHQTAKVTIRNSTGKALRSVHALHKYSDDYSNKQDWGKLAPGETASPNLTVDYTTGALTTGRDWWVVCWEYDGDNKVYFTDQENLRGFMDVLEKSGGVVIKAALAAAAAGVAAAGTAGAGAVAGAAGGAAAGAVITDMLLNSESTSGFKQHILRSEDAGKLTTIAIHPDNTVAFISHSGTSKTGSSHISAT